MVFLYSELAGVNNVEICDEQFLHLKARRAKLGNRIELRNLKDNYNYLYEIIEIDKKSASLKLIFKNSLPIQNTKLILAWAVVDSIIIEKTLPMLNELGVKKILFVYCEFSQKNIKLDFKRFKRILINSSQQCGRNSILEFEVYRNSSELLEKYSNISLIDFKGEKLENIINSNEIPFIGPEGGFSQSEREMFKKSYILNCPFILKSNTALVSIASKMIL